MDAALFTDFDGVMTEKPVNVQLAEMLGVDEQLAETERKYRLAEITNAEFNAMFIPLFQEAGFSATYMRQHYDRVKLRPGADRILGRSNKPYIVTSGPSYFMDILTEEYHIPKDHVCCSRYLFDARGHLTLCEKPAGKQDKADFVAKRADSCSIRLGLGDTDEQDGPFLNHCTIRMLFGEYRPEYLSVKELAPIEALLETIDRLRIAPKRPTRAKPRVFIGSSSESVGIANVIQLGLQGCAETTVWTQGVFGLGAMTLSRLLEMTEEVDYAILVLSHDDYLLQRGQERPVPRDNVIFELGLFAARLGLDRSFVVACQDDPPHLPSDLAGLTIARYDSRPDNLQAALGPVVTKLQIAMGLL